MVEHVVSLLLAIQAEDFYKDMTGRFPLARFSENKQKLKPYYDIIFGGQQQNKKLNLFVTGTNFQIKVWEALIRIPEGLVCSYQDIARFIGQPTASRAVGNAVGANPTMAEQHVSGLVVTAASMVVETPSPPVSTPEATP